MGSSPKTQTVTQQAEIPSFLRPLMSQQAGIGQQALGQLNSQLSGATANDLVAGFTPAQMQGQQAAMDFASGASGQLPLAQDTVGGMVRGDFIGQNTPAVTDALRSIMGSGSMGSLDSATTDTLSRIASQSGLPSAATDQLSQFAQQSGIPGLATEQLSQFAQQGGVPGQAQQITADIAGSPFQLDQDAQNALQQSARGDYLHGGQGFDEAVQASMRAARPSILSGFANQGGVGAASGGLAQTAMQQAASDAFARLFDSERNRQMSASNQLGNFGLQSRQQQLGAAAQMADMGLANQQQQMAAAGQLGQLGLSDRGQQIGAASNLGSLGLADTAQQASAATSLGGLNLAQQQQRLAEQSQRLNAANSLGGFVDSERSRQLQASQVLPQLGLLGANVMQQVGGMQQAQNQQELGAPINAQQQLLQAAMMGLPMSGLLGSTQSQPVHRNTAGGILGGAMGGAGIAQALSLGGPWGWGLAGAGALLGGLG